MIEKHNCYTCKRQGELEDGAWPCLGSGDELSRQDDYCVPEYSCDMGCFDDCEKWEPK